MSGSSVVEMIEAIASFALEPAWEPLLSAGKKRTRADGAWHGRWVVVYATVGGAIVEGKRFSSKSAANKAARAYTARHPGTMRAHVQRFRTAQWRKRPTWHAVGGWMRSVAWWTGKAGQP